MAVRRVLRLMNPLTTARGFGRAAAKGSNRWTPGVLTIAACALFLSALSAEAFIIIIPIPTVQITSLSHFYGQDQGGRSLVDEVTFPCGSGVGNCTSDGFSAAITNGDEIIMTFAAPPGMRFHVFSDSALSGNQGFLVKAAWSAGSDSISVLTPAVINFEHMTGTAPTETYNQFGVGDAGVLVSGTWNSKVTSDFTFTALTLSFTVKNSPPGAIAFFGPVSLGELYVDGSGPGAPDQVLMQLEPLPDTDGDGVPDLTDNCPYTPNGPLLGTCLGDLPQGQALCHANGDCTSGMCSLNQEDSGGIGVGSAPDGIGDACQCGDVNNDGIVNNVDATLIKRSFVNLPPYPGGVTTLPGYHKCQVTTGTPPGDTCNNNQASLIERAVVDLAPGIVQGCHAATTFVPPPPP